MTAEAFEIGDTVTQVGGDKRDHRAEAGDGVWTYYVHTLSELRSRPTAPGTQPQILLLYYFQLCFARASVDSVV